MPAPPRGGHLDLKRAETPRAFVAGSCKFDAGFACHRGSVVSGDRESSRFLPQSRAVPGDSLRPCRFLLRRGKSMYCAARAATSPFAALCRLLGPGSRPIVDWSRRRSGETREVSAMGNSRTSLAAWQEAAAPHAVASPVPSALRLGTRPAGWRLARSCVCALTPIVALLLSAVSACGGGSGGGSQQSAPSTSSGSSQAPAQALGGHYVGAVTIANVTYFGDAVFTAGGAVRLYVGGVDNENQALQVVQLTRPQSSEQFVGTMQLHDGQWSGSGVVIGQQCAVSAANPFCTQPSSANISAYVQSGSSSDSPAIQGNIQVATAGGMETWLLDLQQWS